MFVKLQRSQAVQSFNIVLNTMEREDWGNLSDDDFNDADAYLFGIDRNPQQPVYENWAQNQNFLEGQMDANWANPE